ncbi:MAG TPA: hypothetical protein VEA79_10205 [Phenylobacterium sp.]|nr:hypothetical protein [Phenylobacterium sp.]
MSGAKGPEFEKAIAEGRWLSEEIGRFEAQFPQGPPASPEDLRLGWMQIERQLVDLALRPCVKAMIPPLVSAIRKHALLKPPELLFRELLCLASVVLDEDFEPSATEGGVT